MKKIKYVALVLGAVLSCGVAFAGCGGKGDSTKRYEVIYDTENKYYTIVGAEEVKRGEDYTFTIVPKNGYAPGDNFTVFVNGEEVTMDGMTYTVKNVRGDISISAMNFNVKKYTVNFIVGDTLLKSSQMEYGATPKYDVKEGYVKDYPDDHVGIFTGWSNTPEGALTPIDSVKGDTNYYARILRLPRYAKAEDLITVHYTGETQENAWGWRLSLRSFILGDHPYDGNAWGLIGEYQGEACLEYTIDWEAIDFEGLLSTDKAFVFAFSPNYTDFIMQIEGKQLSIDYDVCVAKIYGGSLYLDGEKFLDLDEEVYNGTRAMHWSVTRSLVDIYAQIGISDIGIEEL